MDKISLSTKVDAHTFFPPTPKTPSYRKVSLRTALISDKFAAYRQDHINHILNNLHLYKSDSALLAGQIKESANPNIIKL